MYQRLNNVFVAICLTSLVACSGGGSSSTSSLSGRVIDGYIVGAKVCLDLNNNFTCDPGEPSTTTTAGGAYAFNYDGSVAGKQVLAEVTVGAVDEDLGPITKPYNLLAPAESPSAVTPLTTLVSKEMITSGAPLSEASQTIKTQFNFQNDPIGYDFKARGDTTAAVVAQTVAAAIATVNDTLKSDSTASSNLSQAEIMKAAINQVKTVILPSMIRPDGSVPAPSCPQAVCTQANLISAVNAAAASQISSISGNVQAIVSQTKSGDGSVTSFKDALTSGIVIARIGSGDYLDGAGQIVDGSGGGYTKALEVTSIGLSGSTLTEIQKVYINGAWRSKYQSPDMITFLDGTAWRSYPRVSNGPDGRIDLDGNCVTFTRTGATNPDQKFCATRKDLSGKKAGEVFPDICKQKDTNNQVIAGCNAETPLPQGSYGYEMGISTSIETYTFWGSDWTGYEFTGKNSNATPTVLKFLEATLSDPQWKGQSCNTAFRVKSQSPDKLSGVIEWGANSNNSCNNPNVSNYTEETTYTVSLVQNKQIVIVGVPALYRRLNPGDMQGGCKFAFAVVPNTNEVDGIFSGDYCPANTKATIPFTGDVSTGEQFMSRILGNFVLSLRQMSPFPSTAE